MPLTKLQMPSLGVLLLALVFEAISPLVVSSKLSAIYERRMVRSEAYFVTERANPTMVN